MANFRKMLEFLKLNLLLIGFVVFGPLLAIFFTCYGDVYSLSLSYVRLSLFGKSAVK